MQHYHSPKSSVRNRSEETVALGNEPPLRTLAPCELKPGEEAATQDTSAEPVGFLPH